MKPLIKKEEVSIGNVVILWIKIYVLLLIWNFPVEYLVRILNRFNLNILAMYVNEIGRILVYIYVIRRIITEIDIKENFVAKIKHIPKLYKCIFIILAMVAYITVFNNSIQIILNHIPKISLFEYDLKKIISKPLIIQIITVCLIPPVFEEMIYRGIILEQLYKRYNVTISVLFSAFLFGLAHFNVNQSIAAFFSGVILGVVYIKTKSLLITIIMHFINNLGCMFSNYLFFINSHREKIDLISFLWGLLILFICHKFLKNVEKDRGREKDNLSNFKFDFKNIFHSN